MVFSKEREIYRQDVRQQGAFLTAKQREDLLKPYLPVSPPMALVTEKRMSQPVRSFAKNQIHLLVFTIIHAIFSIYIRVRQTYHIVLDRIFAILYYHHRAPELIRQDVKKLSRLPEHLSIILELKGEERGAAGLGALMDEAAEISAWCACVGITTLSVYEKTGTELTARSQVAYATKRLIGYRHTESISSQYPSSHNFQIARLLWTPHTLSPN